MMHVVRIKDGKASYCNRFVDTIRLQMEKAAGYPVKIKVGQPACLTGCSSLMHWIMWANRFLETLDCQRALLDGHTCCRLAT